MIKCKEFQVKDKSVGLVIRRKYEPIESVLERVNAWIRSETIRVLNVATVSHCAWYQPEIPLPVIRVWYEE